MYSEIKTKWFCPNLNIGITEDKHTYLIMPDRVTLLKPHYHQGQIKYYLPTKKRVSQRQIIKDCHKKEIIIQEYLPF